MWRILLGRWFILIKTANIFTEHRLIYDTIIGLMMQLVMTDWCFSLENHDSDICA